MNREIEEKVEKMIEPYLKDLEVELYAVEFITTSAGRVLRLYIDCNGGVDLDTCEKVSSVISPVLDIEEPIPYSYHLEVSSPGVERVLKKKEHFKRYEGSRAVIRTREKIEWRRNFEGKIKKAEENYFLLVCDGQEYKIPYENVQQARLKVEIKL